jgi:hypothetical protein
MNILVGDLSAKANKEDVFLPTIGSGCLHEISNDNGVRVVNFAVSKILTVKSLIFPHRNNHKYTWTSPDGKPHDQIDHSLDIGEGIRMYLLFDHSGQQIVILTTTWWWQKLGRD